MELCVFTEPQQGADYLTQLAHARTAEQLGFHGWFRSDHYLHMGHMGGTDGMPGPTDAWTTLAGLARETERVRLGTLVSSATYRHPGILAIQVAQVDAMSGGRAELGLGTGWFEAEHQAYGIPFPAKRFGLLEEQLAVVTGLWSTPLGETFSFEGEHYRLTDSPALPKPVQRPLPLIVGGLGPTRTPALAARYAAEYNAGFVDEPTIEAAFRRVGDAAEAAGRSRTDLRYSIAQPVAVGRTEGAFRARAERIGADPEHLRAVNLGGTISEVADRIGRYAELGAARVYLQTIDMSDLDLLAELADGLL
ncbi:MAG TPA: LLM class F420-dependent oxidoreductase [Amnibacterium sp.]|jgi:F420-dependent oxidoreductase-like protein|uniref:LLM class F420-dependent oxidoreductase n=1 Tax=Amnibacterium sp. TaxID=1872496 RepID=UPI002F9558F4